MRERQRTARAKMYWSAVYLAIAFASLCWDAASKIMEAASLNTFDDALAQKNFANGGPHAFIWDGHLGVASAEFFHELFFAIEAIPFFVLLALFLSRTITFAVIDAQTE